MNINNMIIMNSLYFYVEYFTKWKLILSKVLGFKSVLEVKKLQKRPIISWAVWFVLCSVVICPETLLKVRK